MTDKEISDALDTWEKRKARFSNPENDYDRVRLHYEGAVIWSTNCLIWKKVLSFFAFPIAALLFSRHKLSMSKKPVEAVISSSKEDFLLTYNDLPDQLKKDYRSFERIVGNGNLKDKILQLRLDRKGLDIAFRMALRYPCKPFLYFSVLMHLAQVSTYLMKYNPKAIIVTQAEQDFTASIITHYCEIMGVKYICVQHGEYCYNPSMAYMRFSEYYAWNKETIEILELTNTEIRFANFYIPNKLKQTVNKREHVSFLLKYYLSSSDDINTICKIRDALSEITKKGYKCAIRCHPRGYNGNDLYSFFNESNIHIENSTDMSIGESISDCDYVVSYRSTVLSEAIANSMPIIIDDIAHDVEILQRVHDINYTRAECLLSELIQRYKD